MTNIEKILCDLISIRTDNNFAGSKECVDYICSLLNDNNILFKRIPNLDDGKENIIAGINIQSFKNINSGIVLSGHMDTVTVNLKDWDTNPFIATNINGAIYGRGTVDMKYFIAATLSLIQEFKKFKVPVFLLFSCDEETSVKGIENLIQFFKMRNIHPQFALVGEPTNFNIGLMSKGYSGYTTIVKGVSAHSSCPELGTNAGYVAAKIVSKIEELNAVYCKEKTTLNVGVISGGEGRNLIPSEMIIEWEIRYDSELHKAEILKKIEDFNNELMKKYKNSYIQTKTKENLLSFEQQAESPVVSIAQNLLKTKTFNLPHATEAGFLKNLGIDTIICGAGNENLAHTSSEHILSDDLLKYKDFLLNFVKEIDKISEKSIAETK